MRIAAIDIGTNTVLLLVAEIDDRGIITPLHHEQRLPRLGKDVDQFHRIVAGGFDRIAWILNEYKNLSMQLRVDHIIACATSAVRDAANSAEFLSFLKNTANISVEILSGDDEALWTYRGAISSLHNLPPQVAVVDIGGGSTEISHTHPHQSNGHLTLERYSLQVGSVRLTERFFKDDPPLPQQINSAREYILEELAQVRNPGFYDYTFVGVAGTVTTLACLEQRLDEFDGGKVAGFTLGQDRIRMWLEKLSRLTADEIHQLSSTTEGRSDILLAGVLILDTVVDHFQVRALIISERGLRYGLVIREWERIRKAAGSG